MDFNMPNFHIFCPGDVSHLGEFEMSKTSSFYYLDHGSLAIKVTGMVKVFDVEKEFYDEEQSSKNSIDKTDSQHKAFKVAEASTDETEKRTDKIDSQLKDQVFQFCRLPIL